MADPFVSTVETYVRVITDPDDEEKWQVTYRPLTAGDRAQLQDLARMQMSGGGDEAQGSAEMRLGAAQVLTLDRAIVAWTLPLTKTRQTIESLRPDLFDLIFEHISWGAVPTDDDDGSKEADPLLVLQPPPTEPEPVTAEGSS